MKLDRKEFFPVREEGGMECPEELQQAGAPWEVSLSWGGPGDPKVPPQPNHAGIL